MKAILTIVRHMRHEQGAVRLDGETTMSDGREEREEQEWRREQEKRRDREDRLERDLNDQWKPERQES